MSHGHVIQEEDLSAGSRGCLRPAYRLPCLLLHRAYFKSASPSLSTLPAHPVLLRVHLYILNNSDKPHS